MNPARLLLGGGWLVAMLFAKTLVAEDWPKGYELYEDTQSPDERYGILVATAEAFENSEAEEEPNYFVDLKNHQLLGKIKGADYFAGQNHRSLKTVWADDSTWCVAQYDSRFGFDVISILEPKASSFVQTDIGEKIYKTLAGALKAKGHDDEEAGDAMPYYRFDGRKLLVRALSTNDPKELNPKHGRYAFFSGSYDVKSKKWLSANARPLDFEGFHNGEEAFDDEFDNDLEHHSFSNEEDKSNWLDEELNAVYNFVRVVLPPARFAKIKEEQKAWLKKRDAASSVAEKCKLMIARIVELQNELW